MEKKITLTIDQGEFHGNLAPLLAMQGFPVIKHSHQEIDVREGRRSLETYFTPEIIAKLKDAGIKVEKVGW